MLPSSVRETLLGWHGSFVDKKHKTVGEQAPYASFGQCGGQETELPSILTCFPSKG